MRVWRPDGGADRSSGFTFLCEFDARRCLFVPVRLQLHPWWDRGGASWWCCRCCGVAGVFAGVGIGVGVGGCVWWLCWLLVLLSVLNSVGVGILGGGVDGVGVSVGDDDGVVGAVLCWR